MCAVHEHHHRTNNANDTQYYCFQTENRKFHSISTATKFSLKRPPQPPKALNIIKNYFLMNIKLNSLAGNDGAHTQRQGEGGRERAIYRCIYRQQSQRVKTKDTFTPIYSI